MLWEVDIHPRAGQRDAAALQIVSEAADLGLSRPVTVSTARGYLLQGPLEADDVRRAARELFSDPIVEETVTYPVGNPELSAVSPQRPILVHVLRKPGVMDPVAQSAQAALGDIGIRVEAIRTLRKYWFGPLADDDLDRLCSKLLANDAIEQVVVGPLVLDRLALGSAYRFQRQTVSLESLDDEGLLRLSRERQLYLSLAEMQTIREHFAGLERDPTDVELETVAQTWSEHCSHKTLKGRIHYRDEHGARQFENLLKETIFAATVECRRRAGADDWCVSVFEDNAGVVRFDDQLHAVFKVETHNHPSALEPYGGANTGLGGVIRDPLGTGLGARPVCNTDVFCFAPPDWPADRLPPGVLHPRRVMQGVVAGVRDYGNRMGIPTVNGAIYFDPRYLGNPLVFCGTVGVLPHDKTFKRPHEGDWIVAVGGRTGRDGIHGATFSSAELTEASETLSGGAVQIGNAITEKMLLDVVLEARDRGLYHAITDCGAGGFSSAVGEMGAEIGAEVWLDRVPLKYEGLTYTEIWISEAQERMVLAVSPEQWDELAALCASEGVEATIIGRFAAGGRLRLLYEEQQVADLSMEFLHDGRPPVIREAVYQPPAATELTVPSKATPGGATNDFSPTLRAILSSLNVASKEWVIRQYDHEVQGGSVVKPLVGVHNDGPSDAAVVRPRLDSRRGLVVACGMNPRYGDLDTYHMAASAIDEAIRNAVAVGADPARIALLDNFCWGNTDRPETLGSLVRAALACHDLAIALDTPFISGKDSLNNEFHWTTPEGERRTLAIPATLLISALGQIDDVDRAVTMDLKTPGNALYLVGATHDELGGSHLALVEGLTGGSVPRVDAGAARRVFAAVHAAIAAGRVRACHDLSEGGLAVAAAEMAFAGGWGASIALEAAAATAVAASAAANPGGGDVSAASDAPAACLSEAVLLFSESNSRFLCEVAPPDCAAFEAQLAGVPHARVGEVLDRPRLEIGGFAQAATDRTSPALVVNASLAELKEAWQKPLAW